MIIVSNTSPITNLAVVGQLDLLHQLYDKIVIPQAVYNEIVIKGAGMPGAGDLPTLPWIETRPVGHDALLVSLLATLQIGEAEAIALAVGMSADLILLDERRARLIAAQLGLKVSGLLAILIEAKRLGLIGAGKSILDELVTTAAFRLDAQLYTYALQAMGE